jgi:hypothetical protein
MTCETCKFWDSEDPDYLDSFIENGTKGIDGVCKRYPPRYYIRGNHDYVPEQVVTCMHDWCGEFQKKEEGK